MPAVGDVIEKKVKAFAKDITKFLEQQRAAKVAKLGAGGDEKLKKVTFVYSSGKGSISRSPEQQAENCSNRTSWTCAGAHMVDKARHVWMMYGEPGKKAKKSWDLKGAFGSSDAHFCTLNDLKKKWAALMKTHGLKNYLGGDGWGTGDEFHFELADSKVPHSDKRVQACLWHYAKITRIDGRQTNASLEKGNWGKSLAPHVKKATEILKKREEEERLAELKAMKFTGTSKDKRTLLSKSNQSGSTLGKSFSDIGLIGPIDHGGSSTKKVEGGGALVWDSLARSIFEKTGLLGTKGFDVKISCGVSYNLVTYENLSQTFMTDITPKCVLIYNTPVAKFMGMTVEAQSNLKLAASSKEPSGTVVFEVTLKSPVDLDKGTITFKIDGGKIKATSVIK